MVSKQTMRTSVDHHVKIGDEGVDPASHGVEGEPVAEQPQALDGPLGHVLPLPLAVEADGGADPGAAGVELLAGGGCGGGGVAAVVLAALAVDGLPWPAELGAAPGVAEGVAVLLRRAHRDEVIKAEGLVWRERERA